MSLVAVRARERRPGRGVKVAENAAERVEGRGARPE